MIQKATAIPTLTIDKPTGSPILARGSEFETDWTTSTAVVGSDIAFHRRFQNISKPYHPFQQGVNLKQCQVFQPSNHINQKLLNPNR